MIAAACFAVALTAPSFATVRRVTLRRPFAPLVRGSVERCCVLAATGVASALACAELLRALSRLSYESIEIVCTPWFFLVVPPVIGLAPWVAGEVLSGPSVRQEESFAAALAAAYVAAAAGFGVGLAVGMPWGIASAAALSTIVAAVAYLRVRGPACS
jgi:hypothetical protein